ncbi:hypothetical protein TWF506_000040 [Arthrobotrys conoides]|uniref:CHAT domain-containing protein n=1 Tax=Arthrobotrys conoides TaxID=74498 RepID=A0AAN8P7M9_9PEZI
MATRSIQITLCPVSEINGSVEIEISELSNNGGEVNVPWHTVKITRPEPIARFEELLARHIEKYALEEPFETKLAERVENAITEYAKDLYSQIELDKLIKRIEETATKERVARLELCVIEKPGSVISVIHWEFLELLHLQKLHPDINIHISRATSLAFSAPEQYETRWAPRQLETLNILVVVSRPNGKQDIPYRNVILPLTNISNAFPSQILSVDIVRLGTWEAVQNALAAKPFGHYHLVHFDVHGYIEESRAILRFEPSSFPSDDIEAEDVANSLSEHGVKAAVLNACRSAQKPGLVGSSMASALLHHGLDFVIGMSYNIHQDAAQTFLRELYKALLVDNLPISEAVFRGRKVMQSQPIREGRFGIKVDVQDWINPVLYLRTPMLGRLRIVSRCHKLRETSSNDNWCAGFIGRDYDIACIEKALCSGTIARLQGFRGAGKSTLMKHLQEWWIRSSFAHAIFMIDFSETNDFTAESSKISPAEIFTEIDRIINERQQNGVQVRKVYRVGPRPLDRPSRGTVVDEMIIKPEIVPRLRTAFSQDVYIILFNCFDNVSSLPYTKGFQFQPWADGMLNWLENLDWINWKSMALFSSTLDEKWLNNIPVVLSTSRGQKTRKIPAEMIDFEGLDPSSATKFAEGVINLTPYLDSPGSRLYLERILQYYQYQPLALKAVLPHLHTSGLSTKQYFERTLCSEIQLPLEDTEEQKRALMDIILASVAAPGAIPIPILAAITAYCPCMYLLNILKGDGPFEAEEDPAQAFKSEIITYQDFGLVRYTGPDINSEGGEDALNSGHLLIHPLFTSYIRGLVTEMKDHGGLAQIDLTFAYLVYYLAQRSDDWEDIKSFRDPGSIEIERNWFNILAALRYCVIRPYNWDQNTERLFDFLMNRINIYVVDYKQDSWDIIAEIVTSGITRIMKEFSKFNSITETWWLNLDLSDEESVDEDSEAPGKSFPLWLLERMIKLYVFLQFYAYRKFDPRGWYYNFAIIGLLELKRRQGYLHNDGAMFLEQQAYIAAAEIAHQSSSHYKEGLAYLSKVDLEKVTGPMKQHLQVRERDILAELLGYVMDAESYQGDQDEYFASRSVIPKFLGEERPISRPMRALETRRVYENALRTKDEKDIEIAKGSIYQALESLEDLSDPYAIVLHRFMADLFRTQEDWTSAIRQLRIVLEFIEFNPGAFESIVNGNGRNSYLIELHQEMAECYNKLGDKVGADSHQKSSQEIYEEREKTWTFEDLEKEAALNLFNAMQIAFQRANLGAFSEGWKQLEE